MVKERYLTPYIVNDLKEKMVFVGGPRQVGKTTLCRELVASYFKKHSYFNWDNRNDRKAILSSSWPADSKLLIFDELHKYKKWKGFIKGEYDKLKDAFHFIVTGSARLDLYRRGGDSLQGRYHYYRLHPFTVAEIAKTFQPAVPFNKLIIPDMTSEDVVESLYAFGGFPEPFLRQTARHLRRWHNEKIERMLREDIQDMQLIRDMGSMRLLSDILPSKVGSLLSINSIREDLEVSFRAVAHWIDVLESFYYLFRLYPFSGKKIRSLKKEPKLYLWDWAEIENESARFENLIASHLLKFVHFLIDFEGHKAELYFLRDVDKREVDFLVTVKGKPWFAVEAKLNNERLSPYLLYFKDRLNIPFCYQVVKTAGIDRFEKGVRIISAGKFLGGVA
ncbi:MAG: ATP-binding protein [Nitrospirae bacterium]|nr:ATP-binding protein [Nitrospirota bacterium]